MRASLGRRHGLGRRLGRRGLRVRTLGGALLGLGLLLSLDGFLEALETHGVEVFAFALGVAFEPFHHGLLLALALSLLVGLGLGLEVRLLGHLGLHGGGEVVCGYAGLGTILSRLAEEELLDGLLNLAAGEALHLVGHREEVVVGHWCGQRQTLRHEAAENGRARLAVGQVELDVGEYAALESFVEVGLQVGGEDDHAAELLEKDEHLRPLRVERLVVAALDVLHPLAEERVGLVKEHDGVHLGGGGESLLEVLGGLADIFALNLGIVEGQERLLEISGNGVRAHGLARARGAVEAEDAVWRGVALAEAPSVVDQLAVADDSEGVHNLAAGVVGDYDLVERVARLDGHEVGSLVVIGVLAPRGGSLLGGERELHPQCEAVGVRLGMRLKPLLGVKGHSEAAADGEAGVGIERQESLARLAHGNCHGGDERKRRAAVGVDGALKLSHEAGIEVVEPHALLGREALFVYLVVHKMLFFR